MNIYIDTNIFLNFYNLSKDDIQELKKVKALLSSGELNIYLPEQTKNEFYRNREKIISEAINHIKSQSISNNFPQISKDYEEHEDVKNAYRKYESAKNKMVSKLISDAKKFELNADKLIDEIFELSKYIPSNEAIENKAKNRYDLGNPPGKGRSYGDAVNWVSLLEKCDKGENLYVISDDGDYHSLLDKNEIHYYLKKEWSQLKNSEVFYYNSLTFFFKDKFPKILLADEYEKELAIQKLLDSKSFADAKTNLSRLAKYKEFTNQQLNEIISIANTNNQFFWIKDDWGIGNVFKELIKGKENNLDRNILKEFNNIYNSKINLKNDDSDELPF